MCDSAVEWWPRRVEGTYRRHFGRLIGRKTRIGKLLETSGHISLPLHNVGSRTVSAGEMSNRAQEVCVFVCNSGLNIVSVPLLSFLMFPLFIFQPFFTPF